MKNILFALIFTGSVSVLAQSAPNKVEPTPETQAASPDAADVKGTIQKPTEEQKASVKYMKPKKGAARGRPTSTVPTK